MEISFVIPAYNEEKLLPTTIEALKKEIERVGLTDTEIIVVDNASTDKTATIARAHGVQLVSEPRKGTGYSRHAGFGVAQGTLVAFIDADVMVKKGWLTKVLRAFEKRPGLVALSGPYIYYDLPRFKRLLTALFQVFSLLTHVINHRILRTGAVLIGGNFVVKREALERAGGIDVSYAFYGDDVDIAKRMNYEGRVKWMVRLPVYSSGRRLRKEGLIKMAWAYAANYFSTLINGKPTHEAPIDVRE